MKTLIIALLVSPLCFAANPTCLGEAQIIAKVSTIADKDSYDCKVNVDVGSIVQYNMNQTCPLDRDEVLSSGVAVGLVNGHDCALSAGDTITGVIVKTPWGTLVLE